MLLPQTGSTDREWSAPPGCDGASGAQSAGVVEGGSAVSSPPIWGTSESLPSSPTKVTSAPPSPTNGEDPSISRSVFRSSKCRDT